MAAENNKIIGDVPADAVAESGTGNNPVEGGNDPGITAMNDEPTIEKTAARAIMTTPDFWMTLFAGFLLGIGLATAFCVFD